MRPLFHLGETAVSLVSVAKFIILVTLVVLAAGLVRRLLNTRLLARLPMGVGLKDAIGRLVGYLVLALGLMVALQTLGIDMTSLTVLAGALGIGIGFGLQNIVSNFISGLIILVERPIQLGDRVEVSGTQGDVVRIGGRSTTIRTNDNIDLIIPNAEFISNPVVNLSHGDRKVRIRVPFGVSYGSVPREVEKLALEVAAANDYVLKDPPPSVRFIGFGENSLDFELRSWTDDLAHRPGLFRSNLYFALWEKFQEHHIEIPFPQRDLHLRNPIRVEMSDGQTEPSRGDHHAREKKG
ncbi:MAG: mechanosensitive ion channel family protein [Desulfuromonadales bacterium]|nr:mechanosensitive ion channel family protein [Desulfuromonadales bacterium]